MEILGEAIECAAQLLASAGEPHNVLRPVVTDNNILRLPQTSVDPVAEPLRRDVLQHASTLRADEHRRGPGGGGHDGGVMGGRGRAVDIIICRYCKAMLTTEKLFKMLCKASALLPSAMDIEMTCLPLRRCQTHKTRQTEIVREGFRDHDDRRSYRKASKHIVQMYCIMKG